tara:strand:+ start:1504 stop:2772 length:1269 start_codon:yes stop_codon:yes gene_type:complete
MPITLGCIADDFTGATDLANMLVKGGLKTIQLLGNPSKEDVVPSVDAVIIALKTRTIPVEEAIEQSLQALNWLKNAGAKQFFFKYCSTFDSTDEGNIGPVIDALMEALETQFTIACPAFPETERTIFKGHLFVGDKLLSDSPMKDHPLTPMTDSNLVSILSRQTSQKVGLVEYKDILAGPYAIRKAFDQLQKEDVAIAVTDVLNDEHLYFLGEAVKDFKLITGGSGIALGLPSQFKSRNNHQEETRAHSLPKVLGKELVLSGSCSEMTLAQVDEFSKKYSTLKLNPIELAENNSALANAVDWVIQAKGEEPILVYASAPPDAVKQAQKKLGRDLASSTVENALAKIALAAVQDGFRRIVVAGGETAGAVVSNLGIKGIMIGEQIDPGVPTTISIGNPSIGLVLKSGNFGSADFFEKALKVMP